MCFSKKILNERLGLEKKIILEISFDRMTYVSLQQVSDKLFDFYIYF